MKTNIEKREFMASTWLLLFALTIYPIIVIRLNSLIRRKIPEKSQRVEFKKNKEYVIKMVYLITPLLLFHAELFYLNAGYSFSDINTMPLVVLFLLQAILLFNAVVTLGRLLSDLKHYNE